MDPKQYEPKAIPQKRPHSYSIDASRQQPNREDLFIHEGQYYCLPDLYLRKYQLCEKLKTKKSHYLPQTDLSNNYNKQVKIFRGLSNWDHILQDVKVAAFEMNEQRKWKIACAFDVSRKIKRNITKKQNLAEEIQSFNIIVTSRLSQMIVESFEKGINTSRPVGAYVERIRQDQQRIIEEETSSANTSAAKPDFEEALQRIKENTKKYLKRNQIYGPVYQKFINAIEEVRPHQQISISEFQHTQQKQIKNVSYVQELQRQQLNQNLGFDLKKKFDNFNEILLPVAKSDQLLSNIFDKSITNQKNFPQDWDQVQTMEVEHPKYRKDVMIDEEWENLLYFHGCSPEQILLDSEKMMKRQKEYPLFDNAMDREMPALIDLKLMFRYSYNYINKDCQFFYQNNKLLPLDPKKIVQTHPGFARLTSSILPFFLKYYMQYHKTNFKTISRMLQSNPLTSYFLYTAHNCADLWLYYISQNVLKQNQKFIFSNKAHYPPKYREEGRIDIPKHEGSQVAQRISSTYSQILDDKSDLHREISQQLENLHKTRTRAKHSKLLKELKQFEAGIPNHLGLTSKTSMGSIQDDIRANEKWFEKFKHDPIHSHQNERPAQYDTTDYSLIEKLNFSSQMKDQIKASLSKPIVAPVVSSYEKQTKAIRERVQNDLRDVLTIFDRLKNEGKRQANSQAPINQRAPMMPQNTQNPAMPPPAMVPPQQQWQGQPGQFPMNNQYPTRTMAPPAGQYPQQQRMYSAPYPMQNQMMIGQPQQAAPSQQQMIPMMNPQQKMIPAVNPQQMPIQPIQTYQVDQRQQLGMMGAQLQQYPSQLPRTEITEPPQQKKTKNTVAAQAVQTPVATPEEPVQATPPKGRSKKGKPKNEKPQPAPTTQTQTKAKRQGNTRRKPQDDGDGNPDNQD